VAKGHRSQLERAPSDQIGYNLPMKMNNVTNGSYPVGIK
jgi:hypothetical protein